MAWVRGGGMGNGTARQARCQLGKERRPRGLQIAHLAVGQPDGHSEVRCYPLSEQGPVPAVERDDVADGAARRQRGSDKVEGCAAICRGGMQDEVQVGRPGCAEPHVKYARGGSRTVWRELCSPALPSPSATAPRDPQHHRTATLVGSAAASGVGVKHIWLGLACTSFSGKQKGKQRVPITLRFRKFPGKTEGVWCSILETREFP